MKKTLLYYRLDMRSFGNILNRCPKTELEVKKLKPEESEHWLRCLGKEDKNMIAFKRNKRVARKKLLKVIKDLIYDRNG